MPIAKRLTIENVNLDDDAELNAFDDQVIAAGLERVRAEGDELRRRGILRWSCHTGTTSANTNPSRSTISPDSTRKGWLNTGES